MTAALSWDEVRKEGIGGSDQAARLAISRFTTPVQLQLEKLGELAPLEESDPIWFGNVMEDPLAEKFSEETGIKVRRSKQTRYHKRWPRCFAHLDRKVEGAPELVEIKTTSLTEDWEDGVPAYYLAQVQHYMEVCGYERAHTYVLFRQSLQRKHFVIERDKDLGEELCAGAHEWYERHVVNREPVAPINAEDVRLLYQKSNGQSIEADGELIELLKQLREIKAQQDGIEELREPIVARIQELLGENEAAVYGGKPLVTWKSSDSQRVDISRLRKERPDVAAEFVKTTQSRRFLPKWPRLEDLI